MKATYVVIAVATLCLIGSIVASLSKREPRVAFSSDACVEARLKGNQASDFSNEYRYRDAYVASDAGLTANQSCRDERAKSVNEGFLLSTKAIAEHYLSTGSSEADLDRAIDLLERCREDVSKLGRALSDICEKQEISAIKTSKGWQAPIFHGSIKP